MKMFSHPKTERPPGRGPPPASSRTRSLLPVPSLKCWGRPHQKPHLPAAPCRLYPLAAWLPPCICQQFTEVSTSPGQPRTEVRRSEWTQSPHQTPEPGWLPRRKGIRDSETTLNTTFSFELLLLRGTLRGLSMIRTARRPTGPRSSFIPNKTPCLGVQSPQCIGETSTPQPPPPRPPSFSPSAPLQWVLPTDRV